MDWFEFSPVDILGALGLAAGGYALTIIMFCF